MGTTATRRTTRLIDRMSEWVTTSTTPCTLGAAGRRRNGDEPVPPLPAILMAPELIEESGQRQRWTTTSMLAAAGRALVYNDPQAEVLCMSAAHEGGALEPDERYEACARLVGLDFRIEEPVREPGGERSGWPVRCERISAHLRIRMGRGGSATDLVLPTDFAVGHAERPLTAGLAATKRTSLPTQVLRKLVECVTDDPDERPSGHADTAERTEEIEYATELLTMDRHDAVMRMIARRVQTAVAGALPTGSRYRATVSQDPYRRTSVDVELA